MSCRSCRISNVDHILTKQAQTGCSPIAIWIIRPNATDRKEQFRKALENLLLPLESLHAGGKTMFDIRYNVLKWAYKCDVKYNIDCKWAKLNAVDFRIFDEITETRAIDCGKLARWFFSENLSMFRSSGTSLVPFKVHWNRIIISAEAACVHFKYCVPVLKQVIKVSYSPTNGLSPNIRRFCWSITMTTMVQRHSYSASCSSAQ
jgi:hypothetical protein